MLVAVAVAADATSPNAVMTDAMSATTLITMPGFMPAMSASAESVRRNRVSDGRRGPTFVAWLFQRGRHEQEWPRRHVPRAEFQPERQRRRIGTDGQDDIPQAVTAFLRMGTFGRAGGSAG